MFDLPTLNHTYNLKVSKLKLQVQQAVLFGACSKIQLFLGKTFS